MAFEGLTDKLQGAFKKLNSKGKLNEADVKAAMREVRMALLEADVNFLVVKDFVKKVTERAVGQDIMQSLTPGQQVIKIVNEELIALLGGEHTKLAVSDRPPTVILMCGLQGSGKTTMCGKLGMMLKKGGKKPALVACDIYRPAAILQLQRVGEKAGVCGTAAYKNETVTVYDVHEFKGHIACDAASASEIVVPLRKDGRVIGVLDIDSPIRGRFSDEDKEIFERVGRIAEEVL